MTSETGGWLMLAAVAGFGGGLAAGRLTGNSEGDR